MTSIKLGIHGGGRLQVHGSLSAGRLLVILSRDQAVLDDRLVEHLVDELAGLDLAIVRYEPAVAVTTRLIEPLFVHRLPVFPRRVLKALFLFWHPTHWRHFSPRYREERNSLAYRTQSLLELVRWLGAEKEIMLLARSAGGRVASRVADQAGISRLICLGYLFENPKEGPDPERYLHLGNLRTPLLILQGTRDVYGGHKTAGKYPLAGSARLEWIDTDHGFSVTGAEWSRMTRLIREFIGSAGKIHPRGRV